MVSASHYRDLLQKERTSIAGLCDKWLSVLKDSGELGIPDDASGKIHIAIGQAHLLTNKKFEQFCGLISACEDGASEKPITIQDLQGFWELINIQVVDIYSKFEEIEKLKDNNWEPLPSQENQRRPLGNLNKSAPICASRRKPTATKDFSAQAKERLAQAKAQARKRFEEQCCQ